MAKWKLKSSLKKKADELDDLNAQILELQKRKQEIENQRRQQREEEERQNSLKQNAAKAKELMMNLVYQVNNGGVQQYCYNGYADELLEEAENFDVIETLKATGCPEDGIRAMQRMLSDLQDNEPLEVCQYCGGEGFYDEEVEEVDEETGENYTDIEQKRCDECDGEGYITVSDYERGSEDVTGWMEAYDNWFYALKGMDALDDWTEQSHTHSVILDMMKNNKGE